MDITFKFVRGGTEKYQGVTKYIHTGSGHVFTHNKTRHSIPDSMIADYDIADGEYDWYCIECWRNGAEPTSHKQWSKAYAQ